MAAEPRILVVGAGSAGARHARNLVALGAEVVLSDPDPARAAGVDGAAALPDAEPSFEGFDGLVIASPTVDHARQAQRALETGAHVLVEKPLAIDVSELSPLLAAGADRLMVGYNLRLYAPVERFMDLVMGGAAGRIAHVRAWFGSYLPDWRPGTDYRESYSARRAMGGGVLMDASHELDLLIWLLGAELEVVGSVIATVGSLDIDVEDTALALLRRDDGVAAAVCLDYLSREYRRGIEVVGSDATVCLDWARRTIEIARPDGVAVEPFDTDVMVSYQREAIAFLAFINGAPAPCGAAGGAAVVELTDRIRTAAR